MIGKTYLSWDVGISNLAYCLIHKNGNEPVIKKWGIINLNAPLVCCIEVGGEHCNKKVVYQTNFDSIRNYCLMHSKNYKQRDFKLEQIGKEKCKHILKDGKECCKKAAQIIAHEKIPYCKVHIMIHLKSLQKRTSLQKIARINSNKIPLQTLTLRLYESLDRNKDFLTANEILIENQPTFKNPTMKTMSSLLFSYFVLRGITERNLNNSNVENVKFICPSNKIKIGGLAVKKLDDIKNQANNKSSVYKMTKEFGKKFCKELIKNDKINLDFINQQKKQDDLCDAFLQAFHYIFCKPTIPTHISELLNGLVNDEEKCTLGKGIDLSNLDV